MDVSSSPFEISPTASLVEHPNNPDTRVLHGVARRELVERSVLEREQLTGAAADVRRTIELAPGYPDAGAELEETRRRLR